LEALGRGWPASGRIFAAWPAGSVFAAVAASLKQRRGLKKRAGFKKEAKI
jgi:hypothetical protein